MASDPYYKSEHWRRLRAARLKLDKGLCVVPGCGQRAVVVDHVKRRRDAGADTIENTRSLCRRCDNLVKEDASGNRKSGGKLRAIGCDAQGRPRDPSHWWNT